MERVGAERSTPRALMSSAFQVVSTTNASANVEKPLPSGGVRRVLRLFGAQRKAAPSLAAHVR